MADPWLSSNAFKTKISNEFEDNFVGLNALPDSEQYLKNLEGKLAKLKRKGQVNSKDIISSLTEAKDCYLARLVDSSSSVDLIDPELDAPVPTTTLRRLSSDRQAHTVGELVELLKFDILAKALEEPEEINKVTTALGDSKNGGL